MAFERFLNPKNDLAFKRIFGSVKNQDILIHFLNDIFDRGSNPIERVTFIKTQLDPEIASQRSSLVDIMCEAQSGERFIVEMQVTKKPGFEKRAQYYASKAYIEQRKKDVLYKDLKEVTFLAIADFVMFPGKKAYLSHHHLLDVETKERNLKDFSFSFIELPKFKKKIDALETMTDKWIYFFAHAEQTTSSELSKIIGSDKIIQRAYEELDRYGWSDDELRAYETSEMQYLAHLTQIEGAKAEGEAVGLDKGKAEGKTEANIETATNLLRLGIEKVAIATGTGLSIERIEQLEKEIAL